MVSMHVLVHNVPTTPYLMTCARHPLSASHAMSYQTDETEPQKLISANIEVMKVRPTEGRPREGWVAEYPLDCIRRGETAFNRRDLSPVFTT